MCCLNFACNSIDYRGEGKPQEIPIYIFSAIYRGYKLQLHLGAHLVAIPNPEAAKAKQLQPTAGYLQHVQSIDVLAKNQNLHFQQQVSEKFQDGKTFVFSEQLCETVRKAQSLPIHSRILQALS